MKSCISSKNIRFVFSLIFISILLFTSNPKIQAQQHGENIEFDNSREEEHDAIVEQLQQMLLQSELMRLRDSIKSQVLIEELENVRNLRSVERTNLQQQIEAIRIKDSLRLEEQKATIISLKEKTKGMPVTLFQDTLFVIYSSLGPFNAARRAADAREKIIELYEKPLFFADSVKIYVQNGLHNIQYGSRIITSLSITDALWEDTHVDTLAQKYAQIIQEKVQSNRRAYSWQNILIRWGQVALIISIGLTIIYLLNKLFKRLNLWLQVHNGRLLKDIKMRNYNLLSKEYLLAILLRTVRIMELLVLMLIAYATLTFVFSVFPSTKAWTNLLLHWLMDPLIAYSKGIYHYLPKLVKMIVIIIIIRYALKILRYFSIEIEREHLRIKNFHPEWAKTTYGLIKIILYVFALILVFPYLPGADTEAFKGISVFVGVLLSLGSTSAISNTIAGFIITFMRPYKTGDWIQVGDVVGRVKEKTMLVTRLLTINNEDVTIPNSTILTKHTMNYTSHAHTGGLVITAKITMPYDIDWRKIHELLIAAGKETPNVQSDKEPYIFQNSLDAYYVTYQLNVFTQKPDKMYFIQSDLHRNIQIKFAEAGIDLSLSQPINIKPNI